MIGWYLLSAGTSIGIVACIAAFIYLVAGCVNEKKNAKRAKEVRDRLFATWLTACDLRKEKA